MGNIFSNILYRYIVFTRIKLNFSRKLLKCQSIPEFTLLNTPFIIAVVKTFYTNYAHLNLIGWHEFGGGVRVVRRCLPAGGVVAAAGGCSPQCCILDVAPHRATCSSTHPQVSMTSLRMLIGFRFFNPFLFHVKMIHYFTHNTRIMLNVCAL